MSMTVRVILKAIHWELNSAEMRAAHSVEMTVAMMVEMTAVY